MYRCRLWFPSASTVYNTIAELSLRFFRHFLLVVGIYTILSSTLRLAQSRGLYCEKILTKALRTRKMNGTQKV